MASSNLWADGLTYEPYVGRWSRLVARELIAWLAIPAGASWLDVGCGTGALAHTILEHAQACRVVGVDASPAYVEFASGQISDMRAHFEIADAQSLPVQSAAFDVVVSGLMLNFIAEPARAASEMLRAARPGAVVAAYVWDYAGEMQLMRHFWNAAAALVPAARELDEGERFPLCHPQPLAELFRSAGMRAVMTRAIDVATTFADFEDYWTPFLGGQGPAPSYLRSLNPDSRAALRERVRASLPFAPDGSIPLIARAWAVQGLAPD